MISIWHSLHSEQKSFSCRYKVFILLKQQTTVYQRLLQKYDNNKTRQFSFTTAKWHGNSVEFYIWGSSGTAKQEIHFQPKYILHILNQHDQYLVYSPVAPSVCQQSGIQSNTSWWCSYKLLQTHTSYFDIWNHLHVPMMGFSQLESCVFRNQNHSVIHLTMDCRTTVFDWVEPCVFSHPTGTEPFNTNPKGVLYGLCTKWHPIAKYSVGPMRYVDPIQQITLV